MYALVDCNNFFVSCERAFQPELEGRPVVVLSNNDGCVVARSNESKAMGIKMGTPFFKVRYLVEQGRLVVRSSNYTLYGDNVFIAEEHEEKGASVLRARPVDITVAERRAEVARISKGLEPGQKVITTGQLRLSNGSKVVVTEGFDIKAPAQLPAL